MLPELAKSAEKLCYFYEVANEGSLQATSRKLRISAPSLSNSIKLLEIVIGVELFHRNKSGMRLTEAGLKLFEFCRKYFREIEELQRSIELPSSIVRKRIKVGTFPSIALYFWPIFIESIKDDTSLSLSITTNRSNAILELLIRREIDIALTVEAINHENLIRHELYEDEYSFYVPSSWKRNFLKRRDIHEHAVLYIPDAIDEKGRSLRQFIHSWHLVFRDEFELDSLEIIADFVKRGYGVGILPTKVARTHGDGLRQLKIEGIVPSKFGKHRFFLSYRDDLEIPQSLMEHLLDSAKRATLLLND